MMVDMDDVQEMLDDLEELYEDNQLSRDEESFVDNLLSIIELDEEVTDEQYSRLCEIYSDYFGEDYYRD